MKEGRSLWRKEAEGAGAQADRGRFKLNIDDTWKPDYATKANVIWEGRARLEHIESGKGKRRRLPYKAGRTAMKTTTRWVCVLAAIVLSALGTTLVSQTPAIGGNGHRASDLTQCGGAKYSTKDWINE